MKLRENYLGGDDPFEGDQRLWLKSLPAGARVSAAKITVEPSNGSTMRPRFEETFVFQSTAPETGQLAAKEWGVQQSATAPEGSVEIDFHARRTLLGAVADGGPAILQLDLGGVFVGVTEDGSLATANNPAHPWPLSDNFIRFPSLTANKIKLRREGEDSDPVTISSVTIRSVPTNVSVRLGDMPPFWTQTGELATAQSSPDFAAILNAFLVTATAENGFYSIPIMIHSDTLARLDVTLVVDFVVEQTILPAFLPSVNLAYGFSSLPAIDGDLMTLQTPRRAKIVGASGAVQGQFAGSRVVFGKLGANDSTAVLAITPDRTLAQPVQLAVETPVTAVDLPLANTQPGVAGLQLAIQEDADGKPSGNILTSAAVVVEKPAPGQSVWGSATLPTEFRFEQDKRYWLVLQSVAGNAYWDVKQIDPNGAALQVSSDGGFSWRTAATEAGIRPLAALFRLRFTPERFSVPLELQIGAEPGGQRIRFDRFAPLGRVEFSADFTDALDDYLHSPAVASPCGEGELLVNGSFDLPPHDDATRRIFGVDAAVTAQGICSRDLSRGIDLSRERFITLTMQFPFSTITPPDRTVLIDCAGANPARTTREEIIFAINRASRSNIAAPGCDLVSPTDEGRALQLRAAHDVIPSLRRIRLEPWRQPGVPQGWRQPPTASGRVERIKLPTERYTDFDGTPVVDIITSAIRLRAERVVAVLQAVGDQAAILAQQTPVFAGCDYQLRFAFRADWFAANGEDEESDSSHGLPSGAELPRCEVRWLDAQGVLVQEERHELFTDDQRRVDVDSFIQRALRLHAPAGASAVEIRFVQSLALPLLLDDVSLQPLFETLDNAQFQDWLCDQNTQQCTPLAWISQSGWFEQERHDEHLSLRLRGDGPEDAVLRQRVQVTGGVRHELRIVARPIGSATQPAALDNDDAPLTERARVALRWFAGATPIGEPILVALDGRSFATHTWAGSAPENASAAEIQLIQPQQGGDLLVGLVSLRNLNLVETPLTFLAEAPGELTVAKLRVAYDPPAAPQVDLVVPPETSAARAVSMALADGMASMMPGRTPLALRSVEDVSGVGATYAALLRGLPTPVTTIADLAALDVDVEIAGIPHSRRLALKAAAEILIDLDFAAAPFAALAEMSLEEILTIAPNVLAGRTNQEQARVEQFQRSLRTLRLLLDIEVFRTLLLVDLLQ